MRYPAVIYIFFALLFFSPYKELQAQEKIYVIGVEDLEYYPLWKYDSALKEYKGIGRELLDEFAKSKGYVFEYKPYPVKRLVTKLVDNEIDFKFPDNPYWAKEVKTGANITYSDPAINYIDGVFVRPENIGKGESSIKILGSVLGFTPWDWLDKIKDGEVQLKETPNFDALINQAISGRIDGAYVNADVVNYHLNTSGREGALVFDPKLSHIDGKYLLSTTQHPAIIKEFNQWLQVNHSLSQSLRQRFNLK